MISNLHVLNYYKAIFYLSFKSVLNIRHVNIFSHFFFPIFILKDSPYDLIEFLFLFSIALLQIIMIIAFNNLFFTMIELFLLFITIFIRYFQFFILVPPPFSLHSAPFL